MPSSEMIKNTLNLIFLSASRDSLEMNTAWVFEGLGRPGKECSTNRSTLENIMFITCVLSLTRVGIYQVTVGDKVYKHAYWSGAEVADYLLKHSKYKFSGDFDGFTDAKSGEPITVTCAACARLPR